MKKVILLVVSLFLVGSITSSAQSKKELKKQKQQEAYQQTKKLIESGIFTFEANSANTQKGRRIDLTTNPNFVKFNGTTVNCDMPYFGVSQISSYEGDGGIKFDNSDLTFDIDYDDKKMKVTIKFDAKSSNDSLKLILTTFSENSANLGVTSNRRDFISYSGKLKKGEPIEE